jgi:DNA-binding SARP family transcriptional activator
MLSSVRQDMARTPQAEYPRVQVFTLGGFRVLVGGRVVEDSAWRRKAARQLFKVLLSRPGRRITRDEVVELFWPESDPDAASSNLRSTIYAMRRALQSQGQAAGLDVVFGDHDSVWLRPDLALWSDADAFEHLVADAWRSANPLPLLEEASRLYAGDYLPDDLYESWAAERREALKRTWTDLQFGLARAAEHRSDVSDAVQPLESLLRDDPCDERAAQELMKLLARHGRRAEAIRVYQRLVQSLREELDLEPSPESTEVHRQITAGEPSVSPRPPTSFRCGYPFPEPTELIGREPELSVLTQLVSGGRSSGKLALVAAPAGTGKSALLGQVVRQAQAEGVLCLAGGCYEERGAVPLGPFHDSLVDYLLAQPGERIRAELGAAIDDLAQIIPEVRYHLQTGSGAAPSPSSVDRMRAFGAIHACLRTLAERGPVLVCLEDLHAADEASLQLLHYLARHTRRLPLVLIATYRSDEVPPESTLAQTVAGMARERLAQRLILDSLSRQDTDRLATMLLGAPPDEKLSESLYATTGGNPLFIEQLVLALIESRQLERKGGVWCGVAELQGAPHIVREVIAHRLRRLDPRCREVLAMASVLGHSFEHRVLLAATEPQDEGLLLHDLDQAIGAHVLQETSSGYAFRHALLRDAVYWDLSAPRRMALHARAGQLLEALRGESAEHHAAELAHHFSLAGDSGAIRAKAIHYNLAAGRQASSLSNFAQALVHFSRACQLIEAEAGSVGLEPRLDALEGRGRAQRQLAMWSDALSTFRGVLALTDDRARRARVRAMLVSALLFHDPTRALDEIELGMRELGPPDGLDESTALARLHLQTLQGLVWFLRGRYGDLRRLGEQMLSSAARLSQPVGRAWAHSVVAWAEQGQGHISPGLSHFLAALEAAEASHDKIEEAVVRVNLGQQYYLGGAFGPALEQLTKAIGLYRECASELAALNALFRVALVYLAQGNIQRAREQAEAGLELAVGARIRFAADYHEVLGRIQLLRCEWERAEASFERSMAIRREAGYVAGCVQAMLGLGASHEHRGNLERALEIYGEAVGMCETIDPCLEAVAARRHLGLIKLRLLDTRAAAQELDRALALIAAEGLQDTLEYSPTLLACSDVRAASGDRSVATVLAEHALEAARTVHGQAEARIALALLNITPADVDTATDHVRKALDIAEFVGGERLLGLAQRAAARVAAAKHQFTTARALFSSALKHLDDARAPLDRALVETEQRRFLECAGYGQAGPP